MTAASISAPPLGRALVCSRESGAWHWSDRAHEEGVMNGIEAWVYALRGDFMPVAELARRHFEEYDFILLNLDRFILGEYERVLPQRSERRVPVVGLFEGDIARVGEYWKPFSRVADRLDLIIAINERGIDALSSLTSAPVSYVGIPHPVDGLQPFVVAVEEREREVLLCTELAKHPFDYLAARDLGLPMIGYARTFSRRFATVVRHRTLDKMVYCKRAERHYDDPRLTVLPQTNLATFFERAARTLLWINLDARYTWARYVLDAAALGVPIITTRETGHGERLFPALVVDSPYDLRGARERAQRLLDDPEHYREVIAHAREGMDWYRADATVGRLRIALHLIGSPAHPPGSTLRVEPSPHKSGGRGK